MASETTSARAIAAWDGGDELIPFTVDAALFRELGERLVGRPAIALAELVKNAYDADAREVRITLERDQITVADGGQGMTRDEFEQRWMRVGTTAKQRETISRRLGRRVTGSKGIGRLAVQFLARRMRLITVSDFDTSRQLEASIDWDEAAQAGDLTRATARLRSAPRTATFPRNSPHGTRLVLEDLVQEWSPSEVTKLARAVWSLQSPFAAVPRQSEDDARDFHIVFESPVEGAAAAFEIQARAWLEIWYAMVKGRFRRQPSSRRSILDIAVQFAGDDRPQTWVREVPESDLFAADFQIRVYYLHGRQGRGVAVDAARVFFREFGGVYLYDGGFQLPYYGPGQDWLSIERDHARRAKDSELLPPELKVPAGLTMLPSQRRLYGVVHVDTGAEREMAAKEGIEAPLAIQISRDRLVDNSAYAALRDSVRFALDLFAMEERKRKVEEDRQQSAIRPASARLLAMDDVLDNYRDQIPEEALVPLRRELSAAVERVDAAERDRARQLSLLGALATAGMGALAYEHEVGKQLGMLDALANTLENGSTQTEAARSASLEIRQWVARARATRALFLHLLDQEDREGTQRFPVAAALEEIVRRLKPLTRGVDVRLGSIDPDLLLPPGDLASWHAIFQNVILNAVNACLQSESDHRLVRVAGARKEKRAQVRVQDTGTGVQLEGADQLFEPFVRRVPVSAEWRTLGYGGSGLGLTIVRMLAQGLGCRVRFVPPEDGFATAFELSWEES